MSNLDELTETSNNKNSIFQNMKKAPKLLYNSTIGEMRNARIPILDSAYRTFYRKSFNPDNPKGTDVFPKSEGYYKLGGRYQYQTRRKRKNKLKHKTRKNKRKSKK
jgi:hypothetical protein